MHADGFTHQLKPRLVLADSFIHPKLARNSKGANTGGTTAYTNPLKIQINDATLVGSVARDGLVDGIARCISYAVVPGR